jgi:hypothetical protein
MVDFYRHYDLRSEVSSPKFILLIENESSVSKQSSCRNKDVVQICFMT